ncbi:DUF3987 domain-containing protein [Winogradskyella sp. PC D3.3]
MNIENSIIDEVITSGSTVITEDVSVNKYILESVYDNLPEPLKKITMSFSGREKDIVLLSTLGVLSAAMPNVVGTYDHRSVFTNLYVFIIAPPASGKGVMAWSKYLVDPIHDRLVAESKREIQQYRSSTNNTLPEPKMKVKLLPGNVSSAKCYSHLEEADDSLLIFETEADSLSNMLKQDWGDFSDILRKSFQHETCSISRSDRFSEVKTPKMSLVLSGTPNQLRPLIDSKENGLYSRFVFYFFDDIQGWKDVSPLAIRINYKELFITEGQEILLLHDKLKELDSLEIELTEEQWGSFQQQMQLATQIIIESNKTEFLSVIKRFGLIFFRVCMILTVLRNRYLITDETELLIATDEDVNTAINIIKPLIDHSLLLFDKYKKNAIVLPMKERFLYNALARDFRRGEGLEIAIQLNIAERTFDDILKRWMEVEILQKVCHGLYKKLGIK